ncbi:hypothetical protein HYU93_02940 [Candidatus Daviesbacteria bacterium]|nr:hypothetical protein [Candidatus Daviesbacteria bacterium]
MKKLVVGGAAIGVLIDAPQFQPDPILKPEKKEQLKMISPNIVMVDFAPSEPQEKIIQSVFPQETELIKALTGIDYISEDKIVDEFGSDFRTNQKKQDELFKKYPKMAIIYDALNRVGSHGRLVASAMQRIWQGAGYDSSVHIAPLQNALNASPVDFVQDELGNKGYFLAVSQDSIIDTLKQYPNQKIVNFSFQVGKIGFFVIQRERKDADVQLDTDNIILADEGGNELVYVGAKGISTVNGKPVGVTETGEPITPMTKEQYEEFKERKIEEAKEVVSVEHPYASIRGAYSKEDVEANLPKLFEICNTFPDKVFFVAAGNEGEDLRAIPHKPDNLVIIAEWNEGEQKPQHKVYGADLYVNNDSFHLPRGSSFSTAVISTFASMLLSQGLSTQEIQQKLQSATENVSYRAEETEEQAPIFNPSNLKG